MSIARARSTSFHTGHGATFVLELPARPSARNGVRSYLGPSREKRRGNPGVKQHLSF